MQGGQKVNDFDVASARYQIFCEGSSLENMKVAFREALGVLLKGNGITVTQTDQNKGSKKFTLSAETIRELTEAESLEILKKLRRRMTVIYGVRLPINRTTI